MPLINLPEKKKKINYSKNEKNKESHSIYNCPKWVRLRRLFLLRHPLCQLCLKNEKIRASVEVHHIKPLSSVDNMVEKKKIGYDVNNLMALCIECHHNIHNFKNYKKL